MLGPFLFGSHHTEKIKSELLIALIPHIIRTPNYTAENLRGIYVGTDQVVKINYPVKGGPVLPGPTAVVPAAAPVAAGIPPAAAPISLFPSLAQVGRVAFQPAAIQTTVGAQVSVNLQGENLNNLSDANRIRIKYDPAKLRLNDLNAGEIFSRGGASPASSKDIRNDAGEAVFTVTRPPGSTGITGAGAIAMLNFTAIAAGPTSITLTELGLKDPTGQAVPATAGELAVIIQ